MKKMIAGLILSLALTVANAADSPDWEYRISRYAAFAYKTVEADMNKYAKQGWDLVQIIEINEYVHVVYRKRRSDSTSTQ